MSQRCSSSLLGSLAGTALADAELLNPLDGHPHARFLAFRSADAQRWYAALKAQNCITDVRGDVLRIGFGIYQDEDGRRPPRSAAWGIWLDRNRNPAAQRVARPRAAAARLHLQLSRPADPRHPGRVRSSPIFTSPTRQFGVLSGPPFAILYSVLGMPVRLPCRPHQPKPGHRRARCVLERIHRLCAARRRPSGNCSSSAWASASAKPAASRRPTP